MYSHYYDDETGGIVLLKKRSVVHHEVRPVWSNELRKIGFDQFWDFEDSETPYMWCDLGRYYYRGRLVARTKFNADAKGRYEILFCDKDLKLVPVDIDGMREKNKEIFGELRDSSIQRLKDLFKERSDRNEFWYVAWSGGKDSVAMFDVVSHALDKSQFVVSFSDTDMEFTQTYQIAEKMKRLCEKENVRFYTARSHMSAEESWKKIGPPSRKMRWCCSVHKGTPQTLMTRELAGGKNIVAMTGCRASESATRKEYTFVKSSKVKSVVEVLPILDWESAEVWIDVLCNNLLVNDLYRYGARRVGCALCPMGGDHSDYEAIDYSPDKFNVLWDIIQQHKALTQDNTLRSWHGRMYNDLTQEATQELREEKNYDGVCLYVKLFRQDWKEWFKPFCEIEETRKGAYIIKFRGSTFDFYEEESDNPEFNVKFRFPDEHSKNAYALKNLIKKAFRRAVYCVGCRTCETNCSVDAISFIDGKLHISNECVKCSRCYKTKVACLAWKSRVVHNNRDEIIARSMRNIEKRRDQDTDKKRISAAKAEKQNADNERTLL